MGKDKNKNKGKGKGKGKKPEPEHEHEHERGAEPAGEAQPVQVPLAETGGSWGEPPSSLTPEERAELAGTSPSLVPPGTGAPRVPWRAPDPEEVGRREELEQESRRASDGPPPAAPVPVWTPPDADDHVRRVTWILAGVLAFSFLLELFTQTGGGTILQVVFAPLVTLLAAVMGFSLGSRRRD